MGEPSGWIFARRWSGNRARASLVRAQCGAWVSGGWAGEAHEGIPETIMTRYQAQRIGNFEKVAEKHGFVQRFFCCFPLTSYRMPSRLDLPGLARLKVACRGSRHPDRPKSFQGEYRPLRAGPRSGQALFLGRERAAQSHDRRRVIPARLRSSTAPRDVEAELVVEMQDSRRSPRRDGAIESPLR